jgi:hypothetical protein
MAKQTSKDQLLKDICTERRRLENILLHLSPEDMVKPGVSGDWSVKDILAHLTAWEKLFIGWYQSGVEGIPTVIGAVGMSKTAIDALNRQIYEKNQNRSLDEITAEFHTSYQQVMSVIERIPEAEIFARSCFEWTGKLTLADYITGNTCNHYAWAKTQIRNWEKRSQG